MQYFYLTSYTRLLRGAFQHFIAAFSVFSRRYSYLLNNIRLQNCSSCWQINNDTGKVIISVATEWQLLEEYCACGCCALTVMPRLPHAAALSASLVCPGYQQPRAPLGLQRVKLLPQSCAYMISERIHTHKSLLHLSLMALCYLFLMKHLFVEIARTKFRKVNTTVFCSQPNISLKENTQLSLRIKKYLSCQSIFI